VKEIDKFPTEKLESTFINMLESLDFYQGIGLAAVQVGLELPMFIIKHPEYMPEPNAFINPRVISTSGKDIADEGCLSFPGLYLKLRRPQKVKLAYQTIGGKKMEREFEGILARAVMHEVDHLNGILIIDHISQTQRHIIKGVLKKIAEKYGRSSDARGQKV